MAETDAAKNTIYIDIDDEITSIIDKVKTSPKDIVALVLPKRAAMLQSVVNMKLLKKSATKAKKKVVLVTSEQSLVALAGIVGLHVAKNLQTKPTIPPIPDTTEATEEISAEELTDKPLDPAASVGELAVTGGAEVETIEVDNSEPEAPAVAGGAGAAAAAAKKTKGDKKFKVPNFELFRKRLFLIGAGFVLLLVLWFWAFVVAPKAIVTIKTASKDISSVVEFTADTEAQELKEEEKIIPATFEELKKTETEKVATTGQKDVGDKAKGTMTITNCINDGQKHTLPAGTGFSSGQFTFISTETATFEAAVYSGSSCRTDLGGTLGFTKNVAVVAQNGGDSYNLSARSYTVAVSGDYRASGGAMSGGTTKVIKTVSGSDIDSAKQKLAAKTSNATEELKAALAEKQLHGLVDSLSNNTPAITTTPSIGDEASEVTVTSVTTFSMLGVEPDQLRKLLENEVGKQVDLAQQPIAESGLDKAQYRVIDKKSDKLIRLSMQVTSLVGVKFDQDAIKKEIKGKKRGQVQQLLQNRPGVQEVEVRYKPFWVFSTPKATKKITIVIEPVNTAPQQ